MNLVQFHLRIALTQNPLSLTLGPSPFDKTRSTPVWTYHRGRRSRSVESSIYTLCNHSLVSPLSLSAFSSLISGLLCSLFLFLLPFSFSLKFCDSFLYLVVQFQFYRRSVFPSFYFILLSLSLLTEPYNWRQTVVETNLIDNHLHILLCICLTSY